MESNLQSKVTTLLTGCDTKCQKIKELDNLKRDYESYLHKYIKAYSQYQKLQYGKTLQEKKFKLEYETISKKFNIKMLNIEKTLKSDIKSINQIINQQKKIILNKNNIIDNHKNEKSSRHKILNNLTQHLITEKGQIQKFDEELLKKISIFPYGKMNKIIVNYNRSTIYLFCLIVIFLIAIIILILKIIDYR